MIKLIAVVVAVAGRLCCFESFTMSSASMHPGIAKGDIVIIDKQGFGNGDRSPIPGDLVVFRNRNMHGSM